MTPNKAAGRRVYQGFKIKHFQQKVPHVIALLDQKMERGIDNRGAFPEAWEPLPGHVKHSYRPRRIANILNLTTTSRCTDLKTGRVGYPVVSVFDGVKRIRPYNNRQLVIRSGLALRRMQRSTVDLKIRGIVPAVKPRSKPMDDGSHYGFPAARHFNMRLFHRFGLDKQLEAATSEDAKPATNTGPTAPSRKPSETVEERNARYARMNREMLDRGLDDTS